MSQFTNSIKQVADNYGKYDTWEQTQADIRARKEYLAANTDISKDKLEHTKKRAEAVVRATEIMDARSEDNCENMEQITGMAAMVPAIGISFLQVPALKYTNKYIDNKYNTKIEALRSEINKLTDKTVAQNKEKQLTELLSKRKKAFSRANQYTALGCTGLAMISAILMILWGNSKQKEASRIGRFQAKQNELKDIENFVIYTPEQIQKAEEIAKNIPDEKDRNSITKMIAEVKAMSNDKRKYRAWLASKDPNELEKLKQVELSSDELNKAKEDKELIVDTVKEINIKAEEYSENLENAYDTVSTLSWLLAIPAGIGINKLLKLLKVNPKMNRLTSILVPALVTLWIGMSGTIEQKEASRIGRYQARKDLLKNPARLAVFSDEDMKAAGNIKAKNQKQSLFKKVVSSFAFLRTYYKDKKEYNNYKKTTQKENEKLQKAFKQIELTDEQKQNAQYLQKNVFRAFDEVDEMSQRYSEDIEAGCEIAKQIGSTTLSIGYTAAIILAGLSVSKGKFPIAKIANKLANWTFKSDSSIKNAVNNIYEALSKRDKSVMRDFQKALVKGRLTDFLSKPENAEISKAVEALTEEAAKLGEKGMAEAMVSPKGEQNLGAKMKELLNDHLKQSAAAKWTRNIIADVGKIFAKSKAEKSGVEIPAEIKQELGLNFTYKNYKTLINTGIVGAVPILGIIWSIPYAFNAWLTNIQKKAGKIGVMKAVENIDDPRVFAHKEL